jgi:hypothetical protein
MAAANFVPRGLSILLSEATLHRRAHTAQQGLLVSQAATRHQPVPPVLREHT